LNKAFLLLLKIAVAQPTAFFLSANDRPIVNYVHGKSEILKTIDHNNTTNIYDLENSYRIGKNDLICTGKGSRTELKSNDYILRIGSMSVVSCNSLNNLFIHSGSILVCITDPISFVISSIETNATFTGRGTIILESTENGGFKFIPIEAKGILSTENGGEKMVKSGRMILIMDNPSYFGDAYDIDLMLMLKTSRLINSFPEPLPSYGRISLAIYSQELRLKGKFNALIGDAPTNDNLQMWQFGDSDERNKKNGFFNRLFKKN
jgi:hypothetical protein